MTSILTTHQDLRLAREVIEKCQHLKCLNSGLTTRIMEEVLSRFMRQIDRVERENRQTSFEFNPLRSIPINEPTHSRILGDLLNPHGSHGQRDLFLLEFLTMIGHGDPNSGAWHVSVETGRVNICLWRAYPASIVIIENKSNWAIDQQQQLYRYWYWNIHRNYRELDYSDPRTAKNFILVYMPPTRSKQPSIQSLECPREMNVDGNNYEKLPLDYFTFSLDEDLPLWFERCIDKIEDGNHRLRNFLKMYQEIWTHHNEF